MAGETQDRYILGETGGDQFAGRILAGNDSGTADFAVLPPHFTTEGLKQIEEIGWERFISGYSSFPAGFQKCIRFFLASILWHLPTLQEWFPHSNDDIWGIPMFGMFGQGSMARLMSLREHIIVCSHRCTHCGMSASGTPTKTEILKGMKEMRVEVRDAIKEEMKVIEEKMDEKMKVIEEKMDEKMKVIEEKMDEKMKGMKEELDRKFDDFKTVIRDELRTNLGMVAGWIRDLPGPSGGQVTSGSMDFTDAFRIVMQQVANIGQQVQQMGNIGEQVQAAVGAAMRQMVLDGAGHVMMAHGVPVSNGMSDAGSNGRLNERDSEEGAEVSREGTPERNAVLVSSPGQGDDGNGEIQVGGDDFEWEGWGPGRHMVPLGWRFPLRSRVRNMFMWWNLGQDVIVEGQVRRIRPLKHLSKVPFSADVSKDENMRKNVYKAYLVMTMVEDICREQGVLQAGEAIMPHNFCQCYRTGFRTLVERAYGDDAWTAMAQRKRYSQYSYITYYKHLVEYRQQVSIEMSLAVEDHHVEANRNRESGQRTYADILQST